MNIHKHLITNIHAIMTEVLTPLANILVAQNLKDDNVAAPCFNYYPLDAQGELLAPLGPKALHSALLKLVSDAHGFAPNTHEPSLRQVAYEVEKMTPTFDDIDHYEIYPPIAVTRVGSA